MRRRFYVGLGAVAAISAAAMIANNQRVQQVSVAVVLCMVFVVWRWLADDDPEPDEQSRTANPADDVVANWRMRAAALIGWSEGSAADWDRHVRPMLAMTVRRSLGSRFTLTGPSVFGPRLWQWVDPSPTPPHPSGAGPGPGRQTLSDILDVLAKFAP